MIRLLTLLVVLAGPSGAETARVLSGEHADFTRLVIELPQDSDWTMGRTAMGYGFATRGAVQPSYDLSTVWQRIPRTRLQALRPDPDTGALLLTLACPCHVFPFEYRPGMIVLDIRAGKAPSGSAFEAAFALPEPGRSTAPATGGEAVDAYNWLGGGDSLRTGGDLADLPLRLAVSDASLDPLRDALLRQISRGAVDGIVDMQLPGKPTLLQGDDPQKDAGDLDQTRIRIGDLPGLIIVDGRTDPDDRPRETVACFDDQAVSLADRGDGRPPLDLLAEARGGLYGEFDTIDPKAVLHSVRLHLYLGFGAEAQQYAALMPEPKPEELAPLISMARLIDGQSDPATPFANMLACDGAAALWATLAHDQLPTAETVNTNAIVRSFQALPPHLRRHLGAVLADRLRDRDTDAARMIRDAMERTPEVSQGAVALLDAKADLQADRPEAALAHAASALAEGKAGVEELVALVEAHFRSNEALGQEVPEALQSLMREVSKTAEAPQVQRALVLSLALSGQISAAFAMADPTGPEMPDLWRVVAEQAEDGALLTHAVLPAGVDAPLTDPDVAEKIAGRLVDLGFPDAALVWLGPVSIADTTDRRSLAARANLARGDARQALTLLSELEGEEAALLRAQAQSSLGAFAAAQAALEAAGKPEDAVRLAAWEADWASLEANGSGPWAAAASLVDPAAPTDAGPLARGATALDSSVATRDAISALLAEIPVQNP